MVVGMASTFLFFAILIIVSILCVIFLTAYHKKFKVESENIKNYHKKLVLAYCFSILISSLIVGISFEYCFNYDINLKINSQCFPDRYCKVCFNDKYSKDSYTVTLCFPPNSVYCYKTPDLAYYNSNSIDECVKFMDDELKLEKKDGNILDYKYTNNMYILDCENHRTIKIEFKILDRETYIFVSYSE